MHSRFDTTLRRDDALRRLSDILTVRLVGGRDKDRGYTAPAAIGERHYWDAVGRLWPELVASTFNRERHLARPVCLPETVRDAECRDSMFITTVR